MNMSGWNLKTMAQEISNTSDFNIKATAIRKDYIDRIYDNIHQNSPAILGISFNNQNFGHAIVCIGVEESDEFEDRSGLSHLEHVILELYDYASQKV